MIHNSYLNVIHKLHMIIGYMLDTSHVQS